MSSVMVPRKAKEGWVIELAPDFAEALGVAEGSIAIMYPIDGKIEFEVIPPPSPTLQAEIEEMYQEMKDVFAELKRLGD